MTITTQPPLTLEEFLQLPETKPASEFIDGEIIQKPIPQGQHSTIQSELCQAINRVAEHKKIAYAFPELRCTFGGNSIVTDVAVFRWKRIPLEASGRIANRFEIHPDWSIEVLSPDQKQTKVLKNLLHCSRNGTELGWLINPEEESIIGVFPGQKIEVFTDNNQLPILKEVELELTVEQVFGWLNFS